MIELFGYDGHNTWVQVVKIAKSSPAIMICHPPFAVLSLAYDGKSIVFLGTNEIGIGLYIFGFFFAIEKK